MLAGRYDVVIVGGGHGGAQAAVALRQNGFAGSIAIISDEPDPPYERPQLSKDYLAGEKPFARILLRPERYWLEKQVDLLLGRRVEAVSPTARTISIGGGATLGYGTLIWAAGGRPRSLTCSGHDLAGIHAIRTRLDVDRLAGELGATERVCVVCGGYIGLEAAAVLIKLGKRVTVLEAQGQVVRVSRARRCPASTKPNIGRMACSSGWAQRSIAWRRRTGARRVSGWRVVKSQRARW